MKFDHLISGEQQSQYKNWRIVYSPRISQDWLHQLLEQPIPTNKKDDENILKLTTDQLQIKLGSDNGQLLANLYKASSMTKSLKQSFGRSPAHRGWFYGHQVLKSGLQTPEPLAYMEHKSVGLTDKSWLICCFEEGLSGWDYFTASRELTPAMANTVSRIVELLLQLKDKHLVHGCLTAESLLISESQLNLVNIEEMTQPKDPQKVELLWKKDIKNFMSSWHERYDIYKKFEQAFLKRNVII